MCTYPSPGREAGRFRLNTDAKTWLLLRNPWFLLSLSTAWLVNYAPWLGTMGWGYKPLPSIITIVWSMTTPWLWCQGLRSPGSGRQAAVDTAPSTFMQYACSTTIKTLVLTSEVEVKPGLCCLRHNNQLTRTTCRKFGVKSLLCVSCKGGTISYIKNNPQQS